MPLVVELKRLIQARKLTRSSAAKLFRVTQPRVSDLVRGRIGAQSEALGFFGTEAKVSEHISGRALYFHKSAPNSCFPRGDFSERHGSAGGPARGRPLTSLESSSRTREARRCLPQFRHIQDPMLSPATDSDFANSGADGGHRLPVGRSVRTAPDRVRTRLVFRLRRKIPDIVS